MRRFRNACAARLRRAAPFAIACAITSAPARAAPPPSPPPAAGTDALASARDAWDKGAFDDAEVLYKGALDRGGLAPKDTLDAYVHLGTARAVLGKKDLARAAFRQAASIDKKFAVPSEGGRRAVAIATLARHDEAKLGSIRLGMKAPQSIEPGAAFRVDASLDTRHLVTIARVGIDANDAANGKHWASSANAASKLKFQVPADVALSGATLVVRVDALDAHDNRLASKEARVRVNGDPVQVAPPVQEEPPVVAAITPTYTLPTLSIPLDAPEKMERERERTERDRDKGKSGGFWSSPWTYIVGGAVLAGAGAAFYFGTRPSDEVSLGAARVVTR